MQVHTPKMTDALYEGANVFHFNGQSLFTKTHTLPFMQTEIITQATPNGYLTTEMAINLKEDLRQYIAYDYIMLGLSYAKEGPFEYHIGTGKKAKVYKVPKGWYISVSIKSQSRGSDSFVSAKNPNIVAVHFVLPPYTVRKFAEYDCEISEICRQQLEGGYRELIIAHGPADTQMRQRIDTILKAREIGKTGELIAENEMELLFLEILLDSLERRKERFDKIQDIIRANIQQAPSVSEIAREAGVSQRTLHTLFKNRTGMTPKHFIQAERMMEAQSLMLRGAQSVSEVARMLHFSNPHHFSMQFQKQFGITPAEFLAQQRT